MIKSNKRTKWILFTILFSLALIYSRVLNITDYCWDSSYYWIIAEPILSNGQINFLNFPETYRGYFFPSLVILFRQFFKGVWGWRVLSAFFSAVLFTFSLPYLLINTAIENRKQALSVLVVYIIYIVIWGNFLQYPLSDLPAATFLISGIGLLKYVNSKKITIKNFLIFPLVGILLYAAYNTRAAFLYADLFIIIGYVLFNLLKKRKFIVKSLLIAIGIILVALPQSFINYKYIGNYLPSVHTEQLYNYSRNLQTQQIYWGIIYPRYETYIGGEDEYPSAAVYFDDPIGSEIIERENIDVENFSISSMLKIFLKYPLDFIGIYTRHLITLLTPAFNQIYITDISVDKTWLAIISIIMWMVVLFDISIKHKKIEISMNIYWVLCACIPSLLQMAGAPELRFFMPIYLICYSYLALVVDYMGMIKVVRERLWHFLVCFLLIFILWITVYGDTLSFNHEKVLLINDGFVILNTQLDA